MSSDFLNFGTAALNIAGETAILGESMKMLKGLTCKHCGSKHKTREELIHHNKTIHGNRNGHGTKNEYGTPSRPQDWEFDFRI